MKIKLHQGQEFVIGGYTEPEGGRKHGFGLEQVGHSLIELAGDNEIKIEGDTDEKQQCHFGRMRGGLFKEPDHILLDDISMHRTIEKEATDYGTYKRLRPTV